MAGAWRDFENAPNFAVSTMLLLTDGSILCQVYNSQQWRRLWPDDQGNYSKGTWQRAENSPNAPLFYASAVLGDGTIIVAGGEYNFNVANADVNTVAIYDPVGDTWTAVDSPTTPAATPWDEIGDAPCCVLPDGTFLLGSINTKACAIFDPVKRSWTATGDKLNADSSEETWTLLRDGSVLTAVCDGHPGSERFVGGKWRDEGNVTANADDLVDDASKEIGPAILLPDGRVFVVGATGANAVFAPDPDPAHPGKWSKAKSFGKFAYPKDPKRDGLPLGTKDGPACLLPNGRVLCAAGPVDAKYKDEYYAPTIFFEYDSKSDSLVAVSDLNPADDGWTNTAPFNVRMLLLPTGEVLVNNASSSLKIYTPDGKPDDDWRPTITKAPGAVRPYYTYKVSGLQLNGLSQACSYGDDASMATNYPIVRLQDTAGTKAVRYCRTSYHSTMGVATGAAEQSTWVDIPWDLPEGSYEMTAIANGIASKPFPIKVSKTAPEPSP